MRVWKYEDPVQGTVAKTDDEILKEYFFYWYRQAKVNGIEISEEDCIQDWVAIHWAQEVKINAD